MFRSLLCLPIALPLCGVVLLSGCATARKTSAPPPEELLPLSNSFSELGQKQQEEAWWNEFGDPLLAQKIEQAFQTNNSLEIAWQNLLQAKAVLTQANSAKFPFLSLQASAEQEKEENAPSAESYGIGLEASYEVDLWGRVSNAAKASKFEFEASYYDYQSAMQSLAAQVAILHFGLSESLKQRELIGQQLQANEDALKSLQTRFGGGLVRSSDILRQEQLVESSKEQLIEIAASIEVQQNAMSVLLGTSPLEKGSDRTTSKLPELPPLPATGVPAKLLERRPDVLAAFNSLSAANANLAASIADRYPSLSLGGSLASIGDSPSSLFDTWIQNLSAQVLAPIFEGGARKAETERSRAILESRLANYRQTMLVALQEVEDSLVLERSLSDRLQSKNRQLNLAERSYKILQTEYSNGVSEYLDVLTALLNVQSLQRDLVELQRMVLEQRVTLYRALAGTISNGRENFDTAQEN
ncbi:efflux transporter outer membrane subunit [Pelagicoccus albus]|uniref:Efflux transporter outer membrane subunit n=1 Tax=Pelagicoccus albus TaxID=415222 RepID=A0A7X1E9Z4_9BACT|nr:efflux transporter outer membrane subunit [Pelagicoccus albus]MBC2607866.1 efflux transporter outer membrane subunit [Pelagicoccus albus]